MSDDLRVPSFAARLRELRERRESLWAEGVHDHRYTEASDNVEEFLAGAEGNLLAVLEAAQSVADCHRADYWDADGAQDAGRALVGALVDLDAKAVIPYWRGWEANRDEF